MTFNSIRNDRYYDPPDAGPNRDGPDLARIYDQAVTDINDKLDDICSWTAEDCDRQDEYLAICVMANKIADDLTVLTDYAAQHRQPPKPGYDIEDPPSERD